MKHRILIDGREFISGRPTGIGRVITGLTDALAEKDFINEIILTVYNFINAPSKLTNRKNIKIENIPIRFFKSEKRLSNLTKDDFNLFISPYPKLPLFGTHCPAVHVIHDVLDLTHPAYRKGFKRFFDGFRLKKSLKYANLTWFDSCWSEAETKKYTGMTGKNPSVRFLGIDDSFKAQKKANEENLLKKYDLKRGYILVLGNGLPHKNLGVLLEISKQISRGFLFVGVPQKNLEYWESRYPGVSVIWIDHVMEEDLQAVIKGAFCLAQPSTAEGYGFPPLEAMACGVPTVVSDIPVLVETTGENALKADPYDSREWLQAFEALENKDINKTQVEKGLKWVKPLQGRKGWEGHISDIEELLTRNNRI